jgi:hypothetical protein
MALVLVLLVVGATACPQRRGHVRHHRAAAPPATTGRPVPEFDVQAAYLACRDMVATDEWLGTLTWPPIYTGPIETSTDVTLRMTGTSDTRGRVEVECTLWLEPGETPMVNQYTVDQI